MNILEGFLMRIQKSTPISREDAGQMSIIVLQPYAYLATELIQTFKGQEDVKVKVDSREGQRRNKKESVSYERRRADRRRKKETLVEVVISR
jgi:hypothetical protein